jgi:hypothetical protein
MLSSQVVSYVQIFLQNFCASQSRLSQYARTGEVNGHEIRDSHGGKDVDVGLPGCSTEWHCRYKPTFRINILPPSSVPKMEAVCSSETSVSTYKSKRRYNPEDLQRITYGTLRHIVHMECVIASDYLDCDSIA